MEGLKAKTKAKLIAEQSGGEFWGRVMIKGNLIVDSAKSIEVLKKKLKQVILDYEEIEVEEFEVSYDLTTFFNEYSYLNISDIAKRAGINAALMRQYVAGLKFPSEDRVKAIEAAIREIGKQLAKVRLHKPQREAVERSGKKKIKPVHTVA